MELSPKALKKKEAAERKKAHAAAIRAEEAQRAADLSARRPALAKIRELYVPIFGLPLDVSGINFRVPAKAYLMEVIDRQIARLPQLPDNEFVAIWIRFARFASTTRPAERPGRDRKFLDALAAEWDNRAIALDRDGDFFCWPTTLVAEFTGVTAVEGEWPKAGMLDAFGYHVGKTHGLPPNGREQLLRFIFEERLPVVFDRTYTEAWGDPRSPRRLQKLAETLAAMTRNAKRNTARDYTKAISDWEHDLLFLHDTYYVGRFHFGWPSAAL